VIARGRAQVVGVGVRFGRRGGVGDRAVRLGAAISRSVAMIHELNILNSWNRPAAGSAARGIGAQPAPAGALGGDADRGVVLGGQVLDALGVRRGPGGRSGLVVAEPAPPDHGVHRRHRVDADHLGGWETDGDGHGGGFLRLRDRQPEAHEDEARARGPYCCIWWCASASSRTR
jgi:hypothetical protein